ncbi:cytochrome P450 [Actinokineospora diospyrosa]|uniref:cytochrome P450 n=1 Tax=Actinokineospora diospyrosa TaxID=103728 RepID=UPI0027E374E9|nr:cytochrome P450 [Actinokineospora diospyrosa]
MRESLPAGPRLPRSVQTLIFLRARHRFAPRWAVRYGDTFTIRLAAGRTAVVVSRPADIRAVFAGDPARFRAGEGNAILKPVMGEHSVLVLDGDEHLAQRKRLMPAFNGAALRGYDDMMTEVADAQVARWRPGPFGAHRAMTAITLEIILRVVFGLADGERLTRLRPLITKVTDIGPLDLLGWTYPRLTRVWPWRRNTATLAAADALLHAEIRDRRGAPPGTDVLSRLLAADPDTPAVELRDQMMTLLLAGHETTATALAWALHELARHPTIQHRAREADDEYLEAVAKEAMRLHPVIYSVARELAEPTEIRGHLLPAGTIVTPSIGLAHRGWPDPDTFDPDRFLSAAPAPWIPFGGGVRRCPGAGFALREATIILRAVLRRFGLTPVGRPERARSRNITLIPERGARVVLTERP